MKYCVEISEEQLRIYMAYNGKGRKDALSMKF